MMTLRRALFIMFGFFSVCRENACTLMPDCHVMRFIKKTDTSITLLPCTEVHEEDCIWRLFVRHLVESNDSKLMTDLTVSNVISVFSSSACTPCIKKRPTFGLL